MKFQKAQKIALVLLMIAGFTLAAWILKMFRPGPTDIAWKEMAVERQRLERLAMGHPYRDSDERR